MLEEAIKNSGVTITFIAEKMKCSRNRVYAIISGAECSASEIVMLSSILHLTKEQRDNIFLLQSVN
jgi:plasmid maintenance system antidote protein VapI